MYHAAARLPYHPWPGRRAPRILGATSGGVYIVLETDADVDAHCERARAAGAQIIREPESPAYGMRASATAT
jgi:uncharacterized glyoxalase superfamily protein PhnB